MGFIIIDANCGSDFNPVSEDAEPIINWLICGNGKVIAGGQLKTELLRCSFGRLYRELILAGRILEIHEGEVNQLARALEKNTISNDSHIIALAMLSNCRLLFSRDKTLQKDFKNKDLINNPRGKIYSKRQHKSLLRWCP